MTAKSLRAAALIDAVVYAKSGEQLGHVFGLHAKKTGPLTSDAWGRALVVDEIHIGPKAAVERLGYGKRGLKGPFFLNSLGRRARGLSVTWDQIEDIDTNRHAIRLNCDRAEVKKLKG